MGHYAKINKDKNNEIGQETLVYGHKLSSVGPGNITGNGNVIYEPSNIDLAMKLHYIRLIYFLDNKAVEGLTVRKMKECIFTWCNYYYEACGRFRRYENGRPYIKCNDCGMRFLEAETSKTIEEWLRMEDSSSPQRLLFADHHVLGPEITFSPLVFLQVTFFKCGGMSLGVSWAHVLGDAFSLSNFMNILAQYFRGHPLPYQPYIKKSPPKFEKPTKAVKSDPLSVKVVGPLGDHWYMPNPSDMSTFSIHVTHAQLGQLQMKLSGNDHTTSPIQPFEVICAVIWKAIAKVRDGPGPNTVTVLKRDATDTLEDEKLVRNNQIVSLVKADFKVEEAQLKDLVELISHWAQDERAQIGDLVDRDSRGSDFIMYGSNLTFVDLGEAGFYGFEAKAGLSPRFVNCLIDGIGEEGVVLVLPSPKSEQNNPNNMKITSAGKIVALTLPKSCIMDLKEELKEWGLIA